MRYVILLAAAGAALAPSHVTNRRAVAVRALTADALETKRLQCFSAFDESETRLAMRLIAAAESEEWVCSRCRNINWAFRQQCNRCNTSKK